MCSIRIKEHEYVPKSHVFEDHSKVGHKIDFDNVQILNRASNDSKLQQKEMLLIRKHNPSLNRKMNSKLFTLYIRNIQQESHITRDIQKYLKPKNKTNKK